MDFFDQQDRAQRNTKRLIVLMVLGVIGIIISVHTVISTAVMWSMPSAPDLATGTAAPRSFADVFFDFDILGLVAVGVVAVVSGGSLYKIKSLAGGGSAVARSLGGRRLEPGSGNTNERKLLNVVEEMAIAAGIPVPPVYVMDGESGINAFAAGYEPTHAVIGVTRGAIEQLDRDELQGVIAHEFSHILNGDMRLNIQLIGILHGLLLIGIIGRVLIHSGGGRRGGKNNGNQIALVGIALMLIGYLGTLCGSIIKAAVSRQREYLADSSAVQFTRNPGGIAGALAKIGGLAEGSRMEHPRASELSHMYFGQGVRSAFGGIFATHPPLRKRIERLDPSVLAAAGEAAGTGERGASMGGPDAAAVSGFAGGGGGAPDAQVPEGRPTSGRPTGGAGPEATGPEDAGPGGARPTDGLHTSPVVSLADALAHLGKPTAGHLAFVQRMLADIPSDIRAAAHDPEGARALLIRLLLAPEGDVLNRQRVVLREFLDDEMIARVETLERAAGALDPYARLPVLEIAIGTLAEMPEAEYRTFRRTLEALAAADGSLEPFEWVVVSLVLRHLDPDFSAHKRKGRYTRLRGVAEPVRCLLSALAHAGHDDGEEAEHAFRAGVESLSELGDRPAIADRDQCGPRALDEALDTLSHLEPGLKRRVLEACARTIAADNQVSLEEGELFRVIADWLDCPVPPLLPGQRVA